jgi:hypothetical protein
MTVRLRSLAVAFAALALVAAGTSTAQAAATSAARPAALSTLPVSCASARAWLRLTTSTGLHCYTGNGRYTARLTVRREQIVGRHTACLTTTAPLGRLCATGPRIISLVPPRHVVAITISTPAA